MTNRVETICVVVPAYNAEFFITDTLNCIKAQTRLPDEIVVVDDGSKDKTAQVVQDWSSNCGINLKLIRKENGGASSARNAGIQATSADLIATLDADDLIAPNHIKILKRGFELFPGLILCFADASVHDKTGLIRKSFLQGSNIALLPSQKIERLNVITGSAYIGIVSGSRIPTSSTLFRREVAIEAGMYDPAMKQCNDRDFLLRLSRLGAFGYFQECVNHHQRHDTNLTHPRHRFTNRQFKMAVLQKMLHHSSKMQLTNEEIKATQVALLKTAQSLLLHASEKGLRCYFQSLRNVNCRYQVRTSGGLRNLIRALWNS